MYIKKDAVNNARMVSRCSKHCDSLNILGARQILLKL